MKKVRSFLQQGLSLVELLIAMGLGTFLSVITLQTYLSSGHTEVMIRNNSFIQENVRFALKVMGDSLQKAGYREVTDERDVFGLNGGYPFPFAGDDADQVVFTGPSQIIWGQDGDDESDELFIRYKVFGEVQPGLDLPTVDCQGQNIDFDPAANLVGFIQLRFYLTESGLNCVSSRIYGEGAFGPNGNNGPIVTNQPVVEGVTNLQLLYGFDNDGDGFADDYLAAQHPLLNGSSGRVVAGAWEKVVSVDIQMDFSDSSPLFGAEAVDRSFGQVVALRNL